MKVTKVIDGYIVHLDTFNCGNEKYKWEQQEFPGFASPEEKCYGKVIAFSDKEYNMIQQDPVVIQNLINERIINEEYEKAQEYQNILNQL